MSHILDDVVISAPGNLDPRRVALAAPQVSWAINGAGSFSGFIRLDDLRAAGLGGDLKGYWLDYATSAGRWGGVIAGQPTTGGVTEIVAQGYIVLVQGQVITQSIVAMSGSAGGLARRALTLAHAGSPTFIRFGVIDEGGGSLAVELVGDVGSDILPQIADAGDVEWLFDADRVFHIARRLGRDRSMTVRLVEDRHIVDARVHDDLGSTAAGQVFRVQGELSQELAAFVQPQPTQPAVQPPNNPAVPTPPVVPPAPPQWEVRGTVAAFVAHAWSGLPEGIPAGAAAAVMSYRSGAGSAWQYRRQAYEVESPGMASPLDSNASPPPWAGLPVGIGANNPAVAGRRHVPLPTVPVELTLANTDGCFLWFDLGDTVRIDLGSTATCGRFRALSKGLDVATQTLTVAGELLRDA